MTSNEHFDWGDVLLTLAFVLCLAVAVVFAVRAIHVASRLHEEQPIRPWMTVPYVAHSYRVPSADLYQALGLPSRPRDRRPLADIAREEHRPVDQLRAELYAAIRAARSSSPPEMPSPPAGTP